MPTVEFLHRSRSAPVRVDAPRGGHLVDLCDDARAPVPFSCRAATCATCQVEILDGARHLDEPGEDERHLLGLLLVPDTVRLACQAVVLPGRGLIRIRPVGA